MLGTTPTDASFPNYVAAPVLMKITPANKLEPYFSNLPVPPNAPGRAGPMGIDFGPDGSLYVIEHSTGPTFFAQPGDLVKITPDGTRTVLVSGLDRPTSVLAARAGSRRNRTV